MADTMLSVIEPSETGFCTHRPVACTLLILLLTALLQAQTAEQRARDIVSRMTLDEKIAQLHGFRDATHNRIVLGIPRLGIPDFCITNGPAGAGPGGAGPKKPATALPAPIALASTWDRDLAKEYGAVAGSEAHDLGNALLEAPTINIARVPQNGRTFEGYGEDPFLAGQLAVAFIEGVQSQGIIANVKHYVANNQETDRNVIDEEIGERALRLIQRRMMGALFALLFRDALGIGPLAWRFIPVGLGAALAGSVLSLLGVGFAIWARLTLGANWSGIVTIKEEHQLIRHGPHALVRHPIYAGLLLALLGTALAIGNCAGYSR